MNEKVLIIDDDVDTLRLVGLMLQQQGYQILAASSGDQGLQKAASDNPEVILLDIMMPGMDGYEVARRLRQQPKTQQTPILMFTARSQLEDKVSAFEAGIDAYLTKPTSPSELNAQVRHLIERARDKLAAAAEATADRGRPVAVLAGLEGMGASTLAANLAAALRVRSQKEVILAELTPGRGTLGACLGTPSPRALSGLLTAPASEINPALVRAALVAHSAGLKVLPASAAPGDQALMGRTEQFVAIFDSLASLADYIVLDLGCELTPWAEKILPMCEAWFIILEGSPIAIGKTRHLIDMITDLGIDPARLIVVLNNRDRSKTQLPWEMAQQRLAQPITLSLNPAVEVMAAAARRHVPAVLAAPDDVTSQQFQTLADRILLPEKAD